MPGTLVVDPTAPRPVINVIEYDGSSCREEAGVSVEGVASIVARRARGAASQGDGSSSAGVLWVDVVGLGDASVVQRLGELFGLHKLELEDIISSHQRSKVEDYADHLYLVMRECTNDKELEQDQISLCVGRGWVVTFQGKAGDCYEPVRQRIRGAKGRITVSGSDHLAYAIIDAIIDSYFPALEHLGERLEELEDETTRSPSNATAEAIHDVKRDLLTIRRAVWPAREAVSSLMRDHHALISAETRIYLRDCYDHLIQMIDVIETYREIGSGLMDMYLASVSNRMNEVIKVLTVIATTFMPLSFIAGVYGMNFDRESSAWNMPELYWRFGYFFALGVMALTAGTMLTFFYRRGWIFARRRAERSHNDHGDKDRSG